MATDNSQPRLKLIVTIAAITVVTLFALNFVLTSYYTVMSEDAQHAKLRPPAELEAHRAEEKEALAHSRVQLSIAMKDVADGLSGTNRPELIAPQQSEDLNAMKGWVRLPKPEPTRLVAPAAPTEETGDGGDGTAPAAAGTDAGAPAVPAGDGGVRTSLDNPPTLARDAGAHAPPVPRTRDAGAPAPRPHPHDAPH